MPAFFHGSQTLTGPYGHAQLRPPLQVWSMLALLLGRSGFIEPHASTPSGQELSTGECFTATPTTYITGMR